MSDSQIHEYVSQLAAVENAIKAATGEQLSDLLDLKLKLQELVSLFKGSETVSSSQNDGQTNLKSSETSFDDEFSRFQMEISDLENKESSDISSEYNSDDRDKSSNLANQELLQLLQSLEGTKCRAPFCHQWGELDYHNAMVISTECDLDSIHSMDDVAVKVMFCNPVCEQMKPCDFFLSGHCKFSDDRCRFSHGNWVSFSKLKEFVLPDFGNIKVDTKCLAKGPDDIWQSARVDKCLGDQKYIVKYDKSGQSCTLNIHDIVPLNDSNTLLSNSDDDDDGIDSCLMNPNLKSDSESNCNSQLNFMPSSSGEWEQHTKGIGSKLMEKMGHIWGQGLGKNSDGRLDPIEAIILPAGKSLDKCIEMRESCNPKGPVAVETRLLLAQDKEVQKAKVKPKVVQDAKKTVFDFLNSKIATVKNDCTNIRKGQKLSDNKPVSKKNLNVQIFTVGEDIRRAKKELYKLQQSLERNSQRNDVRVRIERKIGSQKNVLKTLQEKERNLNDSIASQSNHKKLTIF